MYDSIIVGAGLVGMLMARELALAGQRVLILERQNPGQEASWAGGGILSPLHPWRYPSQVTRLAAWSQNYYPQLVSRLQDETGIDCQWRQNGLLILDSDERLQAESWARQFKIEMHLLNKQELLAYEPILSTHYQSGLLLPNVAQVRNPRLLKALRHSLEQRGVRIISNVEVERLIVSHQKIIGVQSYNMKWQAPQVVIAAGAWSNLLLANLDISLPMMVEPVRGQMLIFKARSGMLKRILLGPSNYLIPRQDGRILVGSTLEYVGFNKQITRYAYDSLQQAAYEMVPCLKAYPVDFHWAGLRPGSQNQGIPYIGQVDEIQGLFVNTGHFRNGVVLAPASARLLADIMLKREAILSISDFQSGLKQNTMKNTIINNYL